MAYLSYTVAQVDEDGKPTGGGGTITGGLMVYVINPINQVLAGIIQDKLGKGSTYAAVIPERISRSQQEYWFLGANGGIQENVYVNGQNSGNTFKRGRTYAIFTDNQPGTPFGMSGSLSGLAHMPENSHLSISGGLPRIDNSGAFPAMRDVILTGERGIAQAPHISSLSVTDTGDPPSSLFKANLNGGRYDLSTATGLRSYTHTNMNDRDGLIQLFVVPPHLTELNLSQGSLNTAFDWGSAKSTLQRLVLDNNRFTGKDVELKDFTALEEISVRGGEGNQSGRATLSVTFSPNTPSQLKTVNAQDTYFTDLDLSFTTEGTGTLDGGSGTSYARLNTVKLWGNLEKVDVKNNAALLFFTSGGDVLDTLTVTGSNNLLELRLNGIHKLISGNVDGHTYALTTLTVNNAYALSVNEKADVSYPYARSLETFVGGTIDGDIDLQQSMLSDFTVTSLSGTASLMNCVSLRSMSVNEGQPEDQPTRGIINATGCTSIQDFTQLKVRVVSLNLNNTGVKRVDISPNEPGNLSSVRYIQELTLNEAPVEYINVYSLSHLTKLEAHKGKTLTQANIQAPNMTRIDLSDQKLGAGAGVRIGVSTFKTVTDDREIPDGAPSFETYVDLSVTLGQRNEDWGLPGIKNVPEDLDLSENGIYYKVHIFHNNNGQDFYWGVLGFKLSPESRIRWRYYGWGAWVLDNSQGEAHLNLGVVDPTDFFFSGGYKGGKNPDHGDVIFNDGNGDGNGHVLFYAPQDTLRPYANRVISARVMDDGTLVGRTKHWITVFPFGDNAFGSNYKSSQTQHP
ncbi:hypothetical protein [Parasphaerochaeta coccoides]|uniref:Uncharacterized protein n=1 Tax=Parasphaerochaeta coccoides (strain ATCC BAA-1237 / DSM 17374 / SPN1) TaxID=760011 RepID=F4GJU3_PARC1|nr:hypothetical protein [Parasphaerochaeta coccoides]AEC01368.1 hypothetical protein Spico_0128 [Parasphaerochaeta coccoides DSM 17374]